MKRMFKITTSTHGTKNVLAKTASSAAKVIEDVFGASSVDTVRALSGVEMEEALMKGYYED